MRVASFFRSHSFDVGLDPKPKKKSRSHSTHLTTRSKLAPASSASSISSDSSASAMPNDHRPKRTSLHLIRSSRGSSRERRHSPTTLAVEIESPPLVLYGQPAASTGALLSGQLKLNIAEDALDVESFAMKLVVDVRWKKPFHAHCADCAGHTDDLTTWTFLQGSAAFKKGEHDFPFSFLLPGHLPASMQGSLSTIQYVLHATVTPKSGAPLTLTHTLPVRRAIQPAALPRQSIRIFPPTNLTAHVGLPSVIHPIGAFTASLRLDGIVRRNPDTGTQTHWKLKRLTWRLDETQKAISPACAKHALKAAASAVTPPGKIGTPHQEVRTLNSAELKSGWKADYTSADGSVEVEFPFSIRADAHPACDTRAADGTDVAHVLVVEMVVAEEYAPVRRPAQTTPTGAARVLRMHFNTVVTERGGMGISWDEEQPPLYENVPASPPGYGGSEVYEGAPIPDYEELERLLGPGSPAPEGSGEPSGLS